MYYPYLRGKQFDLLALTALITAHRWSKKIQPIIEPVRDSATLKKTVETFEKKELNLYLIENPQVGTFKLFQAKRHDWDLPAAHFVKEVRIIEGEAPVLTELAVYQSQSPRKIVVPENTLTLLPDQGRFRILPFTKKIILTESFQTRRHVAAYGEKTDDFFSDQHLYFQTDGLAGFSDYTIEGAKYFDKGGPSRGIAIHITYFDAYLNLRVKHFVSDTNDSAKGQDLKFFEATKKLADWYYRNQDQLLLTLGLEELLKLAAQQKFPGLGTIKKWSLAHHLELVGAFLEKGNHWQEGLIKKNEGSTKYISYWL